MSRAVFAEKESAASAPKAKAASKAASASLRIGPANDYFEREADRVADEVMTGWGASLNWSISRVAMGHGFQPKCVNPQACTCQDCASRQSPERQKTLHLGQPGDGLEVEADNMAESIAPSRTSPNVSRSSEGVQRKEMGGESDSNAKTNSNDDRLEPDETGRPKRKPGAVSAGTVSWQRPTGQGEPLSASTRHFMEPRFRHDFGHVRIHRDAEAARSAAEFQAQAYTVGNDIYFGEGSFQPESIRGRLLLAHELTHVVQQSGGRASRMMQRACGPSSCGGACAPRTGLVHSPICGNETCSGSGPASSTSFIRHLDVDLSSQLVEAEMGDAKHATALVGPFLSSPNPQKTPQGLHTVGIKCTACHTNRAGAGMGWFTSFKNGLEFGFHNSQTVAVGVHSHGCVRVPCDRAHWIHDNTSSGTTTVCVHGGGKKAGSGWGCDHPRPTLGGGAGHEKGDFPEPPKGVEIA